MAFLPCHPRVARLVPKATNEPEGHRDPLVRARSTTEDVHGGRRAYAAQVAPCVLHEPHLRSFHLAPPGLTSELLDDLGELSDASDADGVTAGDQPPARVDRDGPAQYRGPLAHQLDAVTFRRKANALVALDLD